MEINVFLFLLFLLVRDLSLRQHVFFLWLEQVTCVMKSIQFWTLFLLLLLLFMIIFASIHSSKTKSHILCNKNEIEMTLHTLYIKFCRAAFSKLL